MANNRKQSKTPLAIFDIDGTIFRSSLILELCFALIDKGIFPKKVLKNIRTHQLAWMDRKGSYENYIWSIIVLYRKNIMGKRQSDIRRVAKSVITQLKNRVYRYTRDLIRDLRGKYHLVALSGSPQEIVNEFNKYWKFNHAFGAWYETRNGKYTGRVLRNIAENKKPFLLSYLKASNHTLKNSIGVGDTETDASFLKLVEKPIAFNPNASLYRIAKRRRWAIVVERKDVMYTI